MTDSGLPRIWLTTMASAGNEENLREMVEPLKPHITGVVAVFHNPPDMGAWYLEQVKGEGKVIYRDFVFRHSHSMNETLFAGIIQEGDLVVWCDPLERPNPGFIQALRGPVGDFMKQHSLKVLSFYGKVYVFEYSEHMQYAGSPHWYLTGFDATQATDVSTIWPNEADVRLNVRPIKRTDPWGWLWHYLRYYVSYPAGANTCLLGLEKNGDPKTLFPEVEAKRLAFRRELRVRGVPLTVEGVKGLIDSGPLDATMKAFFNTSKELNDVYRYHKLGDRTMVDNHLMADIKRID